MNPPRYNAQDQVYYEQVTREVQEQQSVKFVSAPFVPVARVPCVLKNNHPAATS
jgi:hypothetical protein